MPSPGSGSHAGPNQQGVTHERAVAPDIARGYMLLLIAVANVSAYLWGHAGDGVSTYPNDGTHVDRALAGASTLFIDGRVYPMFALLFGYGISQFALSRWSRGVPIQSVSRMLVRRHLWLIAFGFLHALLLFAGDILGAYGLSGLIVASLLLKSSDKALKITAWALAGACAVWAVFTIAGSLLAALLVGDSAALFGLGEPGGGSAPTSDPIGALLAGSASTADLMSGIDSFWVAALVRVFIWLLATPATVLALTVPLCMVLGMLAARRRWLEGAVARLSLRTAVTWGLSLSVLAAIPAALHVTGIHTFSYFGASTALAISGGFGVFGGIGYAALFALLARRVRTPLAGVSLAVAAVGRRSLTFYLLQSLVFALLLSAWGLGLGVRLNVAGAYGVAVGVWILSLGLAYLLERNSRRGPAEFVLRRLTYGKHDTARVIPQPFV